MKSILLSLVLLFGSVSFGLINQANPPSTDGNAHVPEPLRSWAIFQSKDGQHLQKVVKETWDFAIQGGATLTNLQFKTKIPPKSAIVRGYMYFVTGQSVSAGSILKTQITCVTAADLFAATDKLQTVAGSYVDLATTGAASTFVDTGTAGCTPVIQFNGMATGNTVTAGKINVYLQYITHE